jgi:DNA-directed RNA polymerase subunit RPC12/RpoP
MDRPHIVNELLQKYPHLRAYVNYMEKHNDTLEAENRELRLKLEELEQQIKDTNKTVRSILFKPDKDNSEPKKLGPPENHEPHNRQIPTLIHRRQKLELHQCPDCGHRLGKPVRTRKRYVEDIKEPEPFNTEYEIPYYWCTECGRQVTVKPADVIPKCRFGIKIMLIATFLRYGLALPYNKMAKEMAMLCGINVSEGCLVDCIAKFAAFAGPEFEQIKRDLLPKTW